MKKIYFLLVPIFSCVISNAQLLNDFENWHNYTSGLVPLTIPNNWGCTDSLIGYYGALTNPGATFLAQVSKEQPGNGATGTALRATTKTQPAITGFIGAGPMPCLASNSAINVDVNTGEFTYVGGTPLTYNPYVATMWVKNNPATGDATEITLFAIDDSDGGDSIVSIADTILASTIGNFTQISIPFILQNAAFSTTKIRVIVSSSAYFIIDATPAFANLIDGSNVIVDDIIISAPNGLSQYILSEKIGIVYPTLFENILQVNLQHNDNNNYQMDITDMNGRNVRTFYLDRTFNSLDVTAISKGNYVYNIRASNKILQSGKISK